MNQPFLSFFHSPNMHKADLLLRQIHYIANNFMFLNLHRDLPYQLILNINILGELN